MSTDTKKYVCYILKSTVSNRTYIGSTNDFPHRIRQHNGILKGGARATHRDRPYKPICIITGFTDQIQALQSEWRIKHPSGSRDHKSGISNKIKGLNTIFGPNCNEKITSKCGKTINDMNLIINIDSSYYHLLNVNKPNISIISHNDLMETVTLMDKLNRQKINIPSKKDLTEGIESILDGYEYSDEAITIYI